MDSFLPFAVSLDGIAMALALLSMLLGAWRGLVYELMSLGGWVVAFFAARWLWPQLWPTLEVYLPSTWPAAWAYPLGFLILFVVLSFLWSALANMVKKLIVLAGMRPVDRVFGAGFGLARAAVLLLGLTIVVQANGWHGSTWWQQSYAAPWLQAATAQLLPALPQSLGRWIPIGAVVGP